MTKQAKALVAVVDDDRGVLESMEDLLNSAGYDVRPFPSGAALMTSGVLDSIDCLVTDVSMPGMSGLELERLVRSGRPALPVVLVTGHEATWEQAQRVAHTIEFRFLFRKPLDGDTLVALIEKVTNEPATP